MCRSFIPYVYACKLPTKDDSWHYDTGLKRCVFNYTRNATCYASDNKFLSEKECMQYCVPEYEIGR